MRNICGVCACQRVARLGARDRVAAGRHALERIGDRQREDAAHRIVLQRRDQRADQRRRDAGARGVVHEHPVLVGRAELGEPEQPVEYRRLTRAAAAAAHAKRRPAKRRASKWVSSGASTTSVWANSLQASNAASV
jgi:hypothetical protein